MSRVDRSNSNYESVLARASQLSRPERALLLRCLAESLHGQVETVELSGLDLPKAEDLLFAELWCRSAGEVTGLCLDGVPHPERYRARTPRTLLVFKEANRLNEDEKTQDIRRDLVERAAEKSPIPNSWWDRKVGMFVHAMRHATDPEGGWRAFLQSDKVLPAEQLLDFGFIELKRTAGGGNANSALMEYLVKRDRDLLAQQLELYRPQILVACGRSSSPAAMLSKHVLKGNLAETDLSEGLRTWKGKWKVDQTPFIILETFHPSARSTTHEDMYKTIATAYAVAAQRLELTLSHK